MNKLWELVRARLLETLREPEAVFWVFVFPVLLALALGIAFRSKPPERTRVAVISERQDSALLMKELEKNPELDLRVVARELAARDLRVGKIDLIANIKPLTAETQGLPVVEFEFDPARPESRAGRLLMDAALQQVWQRKDVAVVKEHIVTEAGARYIDFLIPGLIGMNLMGSGMWGVGYAIVNARNRKLLKRFVATPMRRSHYLLSFLISRFLFLIPEVAVLVAFGWLAFGVSVQGSYTALAAISILGSLTFCGLGLLVGARTGSFEVVSGWMNFVMLPMWLTSGSFFSYERFPAAFHPLIKVLPLTAVNDGLRAVINEGASLSQVGFQLAILILWGLVSFALALRMFKWR